MQSVSACPMNETGAHTQPDKPGRMIVATRLNKFRRIGNNHTSFVVVCPFHASGDVFFLLVILFFTDFPLKFFSTQSASVFVYLHFAPFSKPHQSVIFVLGAKVIRKRVRDASIYASKKIAQVSILERYFFVSTYQAAGPDTCLAVFVVASLPPCL